MAGCGGSAGDYTYQAPNGKSYTLDQFRVALENAWKEFKESGDPTSLKELDVIPRDAASGSLITYSGGFMNMVLTSSDEELKNFLESLK